MGGFFQAIGDFFGSVIGAVLDFFSSVFQAFSTYILEPVMNFLGFRDEVIVSTSVIASKMFDEDTWKKTQIKESIQYMKKNAIDAMEYSKNFSKMGEKQFSAYYRHGKWDYIDYLPEAKINAVSVSAESVESALKSKFGNDVFIIDMMPMTPLDTDWCKYQMQEWYGYDLGSDFMSYGGSYYKYGTETYQQDTGTFLVVMEPINPIRVRTYESVIISKIRKSGKLYKRTMIYQFELYTRVDTGDTLYKTNAWHVSTTDEEVKSEDFATGSTTTIASEELIENTSSPITFTVAGHDNSRQYVVKYSTPDDSKIHIWIYNPASGEFPDITNPVNQIIGFDMYPVVMLRNQFWDVEKWDDSGSKPASITKERWDDTEEILDSIGLNASDVIHAYTQNPDVGKVQDVFFLFGVSPSNYHWIVSKVLFELFDFIYDRIAPSTNSDGYSASFKENPYNAAIVWKPVPVKFENTTIGGVGRCIHSIQNDYKTEKLIDVIDATGDELPSIPGDAPEHYRDVVTFRRTETYDSSNNLVSVSNGESKSFRVYSWDWENYYDEWWDDGDIYNRVEKYPLGHTEKLVKETRIDFKNLIIKRQFAPNNVKILTVQELSSVNIIRRGVENGGVSLAADDENLVIPLPVDVVQRLTIMERTALIGEAAYLLFYTYNEQVIKWYQTAAFASFLKIVTIGITIVVTIFTFGSGGFAAMTLTSALISILESVAVGVALQLALHLISTLVDDIGLKIALSVAAMAIAAYAGGAFGGGFDFRSAIKLVEIPAKVADMFAQDVNSKMASLMEDMSAFSEAYNKTMQQFSAIRDAQTDGVDTSLFVDLARNSDIYDASVTLLSPTQFYAMSIESYRDFDSLYTGLYNEVSDFVSNKKALGIGEDNDG